MDITHRGLLYAKGALLVVGGIGAAGLILLENPSARTAVLLAVAVWCFARAYYFAFYVIERYIDPSYRFCGLMSLCCYMVRRRE